MTGFEPVTGTTGAPLMLCPQLEATATPVGVVPATQLPDTVGSEPLAVLKGFDTSPGRTEM